MRSPRHAELRRVDGTDTRIHWPDVNRIGAADALEAASDSTMVTTNGSGGTASRWDRRPSRRLFNMPG
jgi:hypothetical protein